MADDFGKAVDRLRERVRAGERPWIVRIGLGSRRLARPEQLRREHASITVIGVGRYEQTVRVRRDSTTAQSWADLCAEFARLLDD